MSASWRGPVKVHPAADLFPMMSDGELDELAKDIGPGGRLLQPIVYWTPGVERPRGKSAVPRDMEVYLLDGRNRLEALSRCLPPAAEHDFEWRVSDYIFAAGQPLPEREVATLLLGSVDPYQYVISANLHRRHLTRAQKRELIARLLIADPERSDNSTAELAKVSDKTVAAVRKDLEATSEIPKLEQTIGKDGKARPTRKTSPAVSIPAAPPPLPSAVNRVADITTEAATTLPVTASQAPRRRAPGKRTPRQPASSSPAQQRDKAIVGFSTLLRAKLPDTLDDLTRLLRDERGRIVALPREKRLRLAAACLDVFGISADDLKSEA